MNTTKHFEKLTPTKDIEKMDTYEEALDFALKEDDILNIAITGPYGAGKSSIINTYKENCSKKFTHISLANFEDTSLNGNNAHKNSKVEIEGKILNQIIHQINPKNIPQTNFKIKTRVSFKKTLIVSLMMTLFVCITLFLFQFQLWSQQVNGLEEGFLKSSLQITTTNRFMIFMLAFNVIIIFIGLYFLVKTQFERPFLKKIRVEKYEIEIFEEQKDSSYFDKHLDDILYLFRNADTDVFVFEDIDRYNMNVIFTKLREINLLINNDTNKKIKFLYLLRDDIFNSKDRTKFFDMLIPIVPVIDSSNSYDKLIKIFRKGQIIDHFSPSFLERLSLYIDDMRILKNIYNEYIIYYDSIKGTELNRDKLLSIITYKNLFPKDFSRLQFGFGHVYNVLSGKQMYKQNIFEKLKSRINEKSIQIEEVEKETLASIDELDALAFNSNNRIYRINGLQENNFKNRKEFIQALKKADNVYNQYGGVVDIEREFEQFNNDPEYTKRKENIEQKNNGQVEKLFEEIELIKREIKKINTLKLVQLITKDNIDMIFKDELNNDIKENPYYDLIKYLIRNGYIDETYQDYITYFWGEDLSRVDKIFLRSITDEQAKEFDYKLEKSERVVARLKESDFSKEEILNFYLLNHLLDKSHPFLSLFLKQIIEEKRLDFVFEYLHWPDYMDTIVTNLNSNWSSIWEELIPLTTVSSDDKKTYLIQTIYHSNEEHLKAMNRDDCLTDFISQSDDFLNITNPKVNSIIKAMSVLKVKFQSIDYENANQELFIEVYRNNFYEISYSMIELFLTSIHKESNDNEIRRRNYTLVKSMESEEPLRIYMENNMEKYISLIIENSGGQIDDSEDAAISILNNTKLEEETKKSYLLQLSTSITNIQDINKEYWVDIINSRNLSYSSENILDYFLFYSDENVLDHTLIEFLNDSGELSFNVDLLKDKYTVAQLCGFYEYIIKTNEFKNDTYEMVLKESCMELTKFIYDDIEQDKVRILINIGIIEMNVENLMFLREKYPEQIHYFICNDVNKYTNLLAFVQNDEIISEDEIFKLLVEDSVSIDQRLELLKHYKSTISIKEETLPQEIKEQILTSNFDYSDIDYIIISYTSQPSSIQKIIENIVVSHIDDVIETIRISSKELLKGVLQREEIDTERKKKLLLSSLDLLSVREIKDYVIQSGIDEFGPLFNGKRPKLEKTELNSEFLKQFKEKGIISKFDTDINEIDYYRAIGRKV